MSSISGKSRPSTGRPLSDKSAAPVPAPRRSSVSERESSITDCKAAYLAVYSSLNDEIESKQELCTVLQQAGRSPTSKVLNKYWKANTESLTFDDFCEICRKEPMTNEDDLIRLFQKIDINGDGYISNSELRKLLTSKGEKMTADEVQRIIDDVDDNGDGKLDYHEFAKMIIRTQDDCRALAYKNMERKLGGSISKPQASPRVQQPAGISDSFGSVEPTSHSQTSDVLSTHEGPNSKQDTGFTSATASDTDQVSSAKRPPPAPPSNRRKQQVVEVSSNVVNTAVATSDSDRPVAQSLLSNETLEPVVTVDISQERKSEHSVPVEFQVQPEKDPMSTPFNNNEVVERRPGSGPPDEQLVIIEKRSSPENSQLLPSLPQDDHLSINESSQVAAAAEQGSSAVMSVPASRIDSDSEDDIVIGSSRSTPRVAKLPTYKTDESSKLSSRGGGGGGHDNAREWTQPGLNARQLSLTKPKTLRDWKMVKSKGCFLFDDRDKIVSHQYSLKLSHDSQVWITIEPLSFRPGTDLNSICEANGNPVDMILFVLNVDNALVAFSEQRDGKGKYALNCELTRGSYQVVAFTTGCRFRRRVTEPRQTVELVQKKGGRISLNKQFKLYNLLTSGQDLDDSVWEVVEEKIELENDQITREGFLTLAQMEAEDNEEDPWVNLTSMGFNKALVMDQASPFMIEVYAERGSPSLKVTKVEEGGKLLTAAVVDMVKRKGMESSVKGSKDLHLYSLVSDFRCCFVIENKSPSKQGVVLDCRKSENVVGSHQNGLSAVVDVPGRQSVVAQHLLPKKESQQWTVVCHDSVR